MRCILNTLQIKPNNSMQSTRSQLQRILRLSKSPLLFHTSTRKMSLFPRFVSHNQEFAPFFRLLDDFAAASRDGFPATSLRTFQPKFDVRETKGSYELHGELPGVDQKDVSIEWSDSNTLTISGRVEHRSERGERPAGLLAESTEEKAEKPESHEYQKPSVEEESATPSSEPKPAESETAVTKSETSQEVQKSSDAPKYWVTERSVGEFHRSFNFPGRVDQDAVKASLKDGILSIVVPKTKAPQSRKINIE